MNTQVILNMLKIVGATFFGMLAMHGYMSEGQATAIMGELSVAVPALISVGSIAWSIYTHWNMKKVPVDSIAISPNAVAGTPTVGSTVALPTTAKVVGALLAAVMLSSLMPGAVHAQVSLKSPAQIQQDINNAFSKQNAKVNQVVNGTSTNPEISCDFKIFIGLLPTNFEAVVKKCLSDVNSTIVADTQRALDSANNYQPNPDKDAINCLAPGLAFLKAGVQVPGKPAVEAAPAVPATATSPAVPAIAAQDAVPPIDPGLVLLFQKYREFVLAGALTACQSWINTPINASIASGIGGAAALTGAAAILVPKP
jgi:hypothetical protein